MNGENKHFFFQIWVPKNYKWKEETFRAAETDCNCSISPVANSRQNDPGPMTILISHFKIHVNEFISKKALYF
jgi:hypothetical protein